MLKTGMLIDGKYHILRQISQSPAGNIYFVLEEKTNKPWILKEAFKSPDNHTRQHLLAEPDTLKKLSHPGLSIVVDVIDTGDAYLLVTEHIEGTPLSRILDEQGAQSVALSVNWIKQLCDILHCLYANTKLDCLDLDLSKIILRPDGDIALTDWHTACSFIGQPPSDSSCFGTASIIAPEERFQSGKDIRTVIYRLGGILQQMVAGRKPGLCPGNLSSSGAGPNIPENLKVIILKCMKENQKDRYQSAAELKYALENCQSRDSGSKAGRVLSALRSHLDPQERLRRKKRAPDVPKQERDPQPPRISQIQFSALAPRKLMKGEYSILSILMYEESSRKIIDRLIAEADVPLSETTSGLYSISSQSEVKVVLTSPDITIDDNEMTAFWNGEYLHFNFAVFLPEDYSRRQVLFTASIYINGLVATRLKFVARSTTLWEQKIQITREDVLSAFVSYASQDRQRVATLIQGMKKARPDMDIFFDVDSLRSGEDWQQALTEEIDRRDILYLCWSVYARESQWVDAEWRYALRHKGLEGIEPIPIDTPDICPPPEELKQKHFNDKLLYIINAR